MVAFFLTHLKPEYMLGKLAKNPEGDIRKLVTALQSIEAYPDKEVAKVKPVVLREACGKCNFIGHAEKECWGQCIHCKKFGHQ